MSRERVFICADVLFPHGDAGANRIQYVAKAIEQTGRETYILSFGPIGKDQNKGAFYDMYAGVRYRNVPTRQSKYGKTLDTQILNGKLLLKELCFLNPTEKDIVYIYASNSFFVGAIYKYCKRKRIRVCIDVVEWHQPFQYKYGRLDIRYRSVNKTFKKYAPRIKNVLAISSVIADYYLGKKCNVSVIPVLIDTEEETCATSIANENSLQLIYPGNPCREDFAVMLEAMQSLPKAELDKIVLHITGTTETKVRNKLGRKQSLLDAVSNRVVFYGWLEYLELIEIFQKTDFLFMSRPDDPVKRANFPSKLPEMMARRVAPLCNKVGDYYTYLEDGTNAIIFEKNTVEDCSKALHRALTLTIEQKEKMKDAARACAIENFDYRNWVTQIDEFLRGLK